MTRDEFVRRTALAGVIVSTAVLSYSILRERAEHIGFPFWASFLYPIGLDALIVGASRTWQDAALTKRTRRLAMWLTLGAIAAGIAAFVVEFRDQGWEDVAFAILIPATLAAALVLTSWAAADRLANDARPEATTPLDDADPVTHDVPTEVVPEIAHRWDERDESVVYTSSEPPHDRPEIESSERRAEPIDVETRRAWVREQLLAGKTLTGADIDRHFGGARNGARLLRAVRDQITREQRNS